MVPRKPVHKVTRHGQSFCRRDHEEEGEGGKEKGKADKKMGGEKKEHEY
jgi:hypothetical protein